MKIKIALVAIFLLATGISVTSIIQNKSREREEAAVARVPITTKKETVDQLCVPDGKNKLPSALSLSIRKSKSTYKVGETVTIVLVAKHEGKTSAPANLSFTCNSDAQLVVQGLYDSRTLNVKSLPHSTTLRKGDTKAYTFTFTASKAGTYQLYSYIQGYDRKISSSITVTGDVALQTATPTAPVFTQGNPTPPPTGGPSLFATSQQMVGPVQTLPVTITPGAEPGIHEADGSITLLGKDKTTYTALPAILIQYANSATSPAAKMRFTAYANAISQVVAETSHSDWSSSNMAPNLLVLKLQKNQEGLIVEKKSFFASVIAVIKRVFVAQTSSNSGSSWDISSVGIANNTCVRYFMATDNPSANDITLGAYTAEAKAMIESTNKNWSKDIYEFKNGICGIFSAYQSLKDFDVSAAQSEAEYKTKHTASPYDNSGYYKNGLFVNSITMNSVVKKSKIDKPETTLATVANMHTVFNNFGPADFSCSLISLGNEDSAIAAKEIINSCRSDVTFAYGFISNKIGHAEHVTKIDYASSTKHITVYADDGTDQHVSGNYAFMSAERGKNKYVLKPNESSNVPTLVSVSLPKLPASLRISVFGNDNALNSLNYSTLLVCTDKSDVRRTEPPIAAYEYSYYHDKIWMDFIKQTNAGEIIKQFDARGVKYDKSDLPDFSTCNKDNIGTAVQVLKSKLPAFYKKWNRAAYDNKGYIKDDVKSLLMEEEAKIYAEADSYIPDKVCIQANKIDWEFTPAQTASYLAWSNGSWLDGVPKPKCELLK